MLLTSRHLFVALFAVLAAAGVVVATIEPDLRPYAIGAAAVATAAAIAMYFMAPRRSTGPVEPDEIGELGAARRAELIRGTSKFLHEMRYRYSVRADPNVSRDRTCFTAEVNSVRLGFVPALVTDNTNDRQGYGYVAFVYDHRRWRGPGLPCPAGQEEAVRHAARCVSPLAKDEETKW